MALEQRDRFSDFSNLLYSATKSLHRLKTRAMDGYGLSSAHPFCLRALQMKPEGMTRTQLATACSVDKAQISRIVSELVERGYVSEASKGAGYRKKIILTDRGRQIACEIDDKVNRVLTYVSGEIPPDDIEQMYCTMSRICENLKRAEEMPLDDGEALNEIV